MERINIEKLEIIKNDLKNGILQPLLKKVINDDTLALEFREDYINIYYRGGSVSRLKLTDTNIYEDYFNNNYKIPSSEVPEDEEDFNQKFQMTIKNEADCETLVTEIIRRKEFMNAFFAVGSKKEREYQQVVERENNARKDSNYYVADIEYKIDDNRFDMIAVQRKDGKDYNKLKLAIIEMKYGEKAIANKSGVYDHFEGVKGLSTQQIKDIIEDAEMILKCKEELGLIKANEYIDRGIKINVVDEFDLIYFISAITQKHKTKLIEELDKIRNDLENDNQEREIKINVKVFCPYMAGNIMFDKDIISLDDFKRLTEFRNNM